MLPLPASQLPLLPDWAEQDSLGRLRGDGALYHALQGCPCLALLWFPNGTRQVPEP